MSVPRKIFLFFLCDTPSRKCYYVENNIVKLASIASKIPLWLKTSPDGWKEITLSFGRSAQYYGLNRSFSVPLRFTEDGAAIIRELYYKGRGVEALLSLLILKWNDQTDIYELYYDGQLDFSKIDDDVNTGVGINLMEGGITRLLTAYDKQVFEIPCDGSIHENIKCNDDGTILDDTFYYKIIPFTSDGSVLFSPLPVSFSNNSGDSAGVIHGDQTFDPQNINTSWYKTSGNYMLSSVDPITVTITGFITVESANPNNVARFQLKFLTSNRTSIADDTYQLLSHTTTNGYLKLVTTQRTYHYSITIPLASNERLELVYLNQIAAWTNEQPLKILGGNFSVQLSSRFNQTAIWGMTLRDVFKLVMAEVDALSTQGTETYSYQTISTLLDANTNIFVTSGDAIRASGDSSYSKYYNLKNLDVNLNAVIATQDSFGPVLKITMEQVFGISNVVLNAALGRGSDGKTIFIEDKGKVYDSSKVDMDLGEVAHFHTSVPTDLLFNKLQIGYPEQQYDEKGGKYETNTTALYAGPIKTIQQELSLICPARADSYGIEKLRSNLNQTSTTQNAGDNHIFLLNINYSTFIYDYFKGFFDSAITDPTQSVNTNVILVKQTYIQDLPMFNSYGEYFLRRNDSSLFVFNQPGLSATYTVALVMNALLNGPPGETFTFDVMIGNTVIYTQTVTCVGVNTPVTMTGSIPNALFNQNTCIYVRGTSSRLAAVVINNCQLTVATLGAVNQLQANTSGNITLPTGAQRYLIPMEDVTAAQILLKDVVSHGFDYYLFNSILINSFFTYSFFVSGVINGLAGQNATFTKFYNGVQENSFSVSGDGSGNWLTRQGNMDLSRVWTLNDFVFITGSLDNTNFQIQSMFFLAQSQIKAYNLKRATYDSISGITHPETAYNIEDFSPKRLFKKHSNYFRSVLFNQIPGQITWKTLSKNRFLQTIKNGVIYDEDASEPISSMDPPLFLPFIMEFDTEVPDTFAAIMNNAVNAHIKFSVNGVDLYGFPIEMSAKPSLNESQKWKLLCSPLVDPADLVDLEFTGLNFLDMYTMYVPTIVGAKFVPQVVVRNPKYNFVDMDSDWFINQFKTWTSHTNYFQKVQTTDTTPLQIRTNGLAPVTLTVKNCKGLSVQTQVLNPLATASLNGTQNLFQGQIDWTILPADDTYYIICQAGSGVNVSTAISEGFWLKTNWPNTVLLEYTHKKNTQSAIFTERFTGAMRVEGGLIDFNPEAEFATFVDEPEDIDVINGRRFRSFHLMLGNSTDGLPDWVIDKVNGIMLLSHVLIDGLQYTRENGAKFEVTKFPGQPKKYWSIHIRPAKNFDGITFGLDGGMVNTAISVIYSIDGAAFGANSGISNVIEADFFATAGDFGNDFSDDF